MATEQIEVLQKKLNRTADADLKEKIKERLAPIMQMCRDIDEREYELPEKNQTAQKTTVVIRPSELVRLVGESVFVQRRDQNRLKHTDAFIKKVGAAD